MNRKAWLNKWKDRRAQLLKDKETLSWTQLAKKYRRAKSVLQRQIQRARFEAPI